MLHTDHMPQLLEVFPTSWQRQRKNGLIWDKKQRENVCNLISPKARASENARTKNLGMQDCIPRPEEIKKKKIAVNR